MAIKNKVIQTVLKLKDDFTKPLNEAKKTVIKFTKGNEKEQERFAKIVKKTQNSIAKDLKKIKNNFKNLARNVTKSIESISYKGLQKGMDMLKKFSLLGGTLGVASLGAGVFEGMDYETYRVQLITATKDTQKATKLMKNAIQFANKTPFETGTIIEATSKFESMGLSAEKWLAITADMAGATSKDMIQGVEAVIDAVASGEFERLKEFGLSKKTLEDLDTAGKVFDNKGSVISQTALAELLFSEMEKRYKGGAESLSKTTKGMWSTVTGVFKNSMAKIVGIMDDGTVRQGSLLDILRRYIQRVADTLVRWQQDGTIEKISAKFDNFLVKCKEVFNFLKSKIDEIKAKFQKWKQDGTIDNLKEKISNIFERIIDLIPKVIKFVGSFLKNLKYIAPVVMGIVAGIKTWGIVSNAAAIATDLLAKKQAILNIAAKVFNKAAWSNPWVLVIGAIVGAIAFLILNWDKVNNFLEKHSIIINHLIIPAIQGLTISFTALTLWQKKVVIWNSIIKTKSLFFIMWQKLTMGVAKAKIFLSTVMGILTNKIKLVTLAQSIFNKVSKANIMGIVLTVVITLLMIVIKNWDLVKAKIVEVGLKFIEFKEKFEVVFNIFAEKFPLIANTFKDIFGGVKAIFDGITNFLVNVFTGNWEGALEGLKQIAKGVFDVIKGYFLAPFRLFATGINWVIDKVNSIKIDIPDWIPFVGGKTFGFNIPKIPNFATGTSYHRGGLARINEGGRGEIVDLPNGSKVIPADKSDKLLNKNSNNVNIVVNINNTNNADEIVDIIVNKLKLALNNL